jgi:hypothetical protein
MANTDLRLLYNASDRFETPGRSAARPQVPSVEVGGDPSQGHALAAQPPDLCDCGLLLWVHFQVFAVCGEAGAECDIPHPR